MNSNQAKEFADVVGVILVGGRGERLGGIRKETLRMDSMTLLDRATSLLLEFFDEIRLSSPRPEEFSNLEHKAVADLPGVEGPLGGLLGALAAARDSGRVGVFLLGVDQIGANRGTIRRVLEEGLRNGAAMAHDGEFAYPTISYIAVRHLAEIERLARRDGIRSMRLVLEHVGAAKVLISKLEAADIDTPDDLMASGAVRPK